MDNNLKNLLKIDTQAEKGKIIRFIKEKLKQLDKDGVVLGLSGGLDSSTCAYLLTEALGKNKILGLILPERDSGKINMDHARMVAKNLGIKTTEIDISKILDYIGVYKIGPDELKTKADVESMQQKTEIAKKYWVPASIYIPRPRSEFVPRPRLIRRLSEGLHRELTLVSTPAGFGKTTLVSRLIDDLRAEAATQVQLEASRRAKRPVTSMLS